MSAFSRGYFFRHQFSYSSRTTLSFSPSTTFKRPRFLSSTSILRAATKTALQRNVKNTLPNKSSFKPTKSPVPSQPAIYQSYASKLAQKPHPTLLYQSPSHAGFMIGSYVGAATCFGYAIYFWSMYLKPPEGIDRWIPIAFGGSAFIMAVAGGYFLLGPAWIVCSITAMPHSALKAAGVITKAGPAIEGMKIEVALRKMLPIPFMPARKLYVKPEEIRLDHQLAIFDVKATAAELRAIRIAEAEKAKKVLEYEQTHLLSKGPRMIGRMVSKAVFDIFMASRRTWTQEGFANIWVKGYKYKLDISGGWALDGGRALDWLVTIKQKM